MKRFSAVMLATVLLISVVSTAHASHYYSEDLLCTSISCNGTYRPHNCVHEDPEPEPVDCPDGVVNCECTRIRIIHHFACTSCRNIVYVVTYTYRHSK